MKARHYLMLIVVMFAVVPMTHAQQRTERRLPAPAAVRAVGGGAPARTVVQDSGFESAYESEAVYISDAWKAESSVFMSPICVADSCGHNSLFAGPQAGSAFAYFGGTGDAESGFIQQKIVVPETAYVHLSYYVWYSFEGVTPTLTVTVDSVVVDTLPAGTTADYVERIIDLSAFADGKTHKVRFSYNKPAGGYADISIDSITMYKGNNYSPFGAGFESDTDWWVVKRSTGDKIVCSEPGKVFGFSGDCAFRFKGGVDENSKLKQSFALLRGLPAEAARAPGKYAAYLGAFVNAPSTVRGTMTLRLTLSDESVVKGKIALVGKGKYKWLQTPVVQYDGTLSIIAILISFKHSSTSGKTYIDDVEVFEVADYS